MIKFRRVYVLKGAEAILKAIADERKKSGNTHAYSMQHQRVSNLTEAINTFSSPKDEFVFLTFTEARELMLKKDPTFDYSDGILPLLIE